MTCLLPPLKSIGLPCTQINTDTPLMDSRSGFGPFRTALKPRSITSSPSCTRLTVGLTSRGNTPTAMTLAVRTMRLSDLTSQSTCLATLPAGVSVSFVLAFHLSLRYTGLSASTATTVSNKP